MELEFLFASLFNLGMNLLYTLIALLVGIWGLRLIDRSILTSLDIQEELKKGNVAVAIFSSTVLLFVAIMVSFGLRG
ncbi:MAG: DUF350 domain-containing protein [Candidatus Omnitrophica bacterium]|nr:DUF350 domain-containing protein [Candidatus Omnitrophota bacterium]